MATSNVKVGADSNRVGLGLAEENDFAVFPGGSLEEIRFTQESLSQNTNSTISNEIRSDRQVPDVIRTGVSAQGGFQGELSYNVTALEKAFKGVLGASSDLGTPPSRLGPGQIDAQASDNTFRTDSGATGIDFSNFSVGDWIKTEGFSNAVNNGYFQVTNVDTSTSSDHNIKVEGASLTDETGSGDEDIRGSAVIRNGVTDCSFSLVKQFNDLNGGSGLEARVLGYRFGSTTINLNPSSIATVQFGGQGQKLTDTLGSDLTDNSASLDFTTVSSLTAAATNEVMETTGGIADFIINRASPLAATPQSLTMNPTSNLRNQDALTAGLGPTGIAAGRFEVSGSFTAYFEDKKLLEEHLLFNDVDLAVIAKDGAGNAYLFDLPAVKLAGNGSPQAGGTDQDVVTSFDIQAKRSTQANQDYMFAIHKFAA